MGTYAFPGNECGTFEKLVFSCRCWSFCNIYQLQVTVLLIVFIILLAYMVTGLLGSSLMLPACTLQDKPPPHLEGYLLKQNPRSRLGRRGWKSYFFFVMILM